MLFFSLWGILAWLIGTLIFRIGGEFFFFPENPLSMILVFGASIPLTAILSYPVYSWKQISPSERPLAVVSAALPALVLDVLSVLWFPAVFPNLPVSASAPFAACLLWNYFLFLAAALIPTPAGIVEATRHGGYT